MPNQSLRRRLANTHGDGDGNGNGNGNAYCYRGTEVYSYTAATANASSSLVKPVTNVRFFGDSQSLASPRIAYGSCADFARSALRYATTMGILPT